MQDTLISSHLTQLPCMVLCAGTSVRFGADKMLADLAGKPVVAHVLERLRHQTGALALNASANDAYLQFDVPVIEDCLGGSLGPLIGILTAMKWAAENQHTHVLTCAGDTPFIPHDWGVRLAAHRGEGIVVSRSKGGFHYVCALWPVDLLPKLERAIQDGTRGVGKWISQQKNVHVMFEMIDGSEPFFNINTHGDLTQVASILSTK